MEYRLNDKYGSVIVLEEYDGNYSMISAREKEGKIYNQWCRVQTGKDKFAERAMPLGVRIGNKSQTVEALTMFIEQLTGAPVALVNDDDIPF
uniref:Uncharacterized protein n=1 Tax=viral metagenome TaxID=1070528 RepID=A0A6H1ZGK7_9ZZZZ